MRRTLAIGLGVLLGAGVLAAATGDGAEMETQWRAERLRRLTAPDGWLTLVGLHFLFPGANTFGRAPDNAIVLAAGPAHFGIVTLSGDAPAVFTAADGVDARIGGRTAARAELRSDRDGDPTVVVSGTVSVLVIERGGRKALRVKDSAAERRTHFLGLDTFPADPSWRIEAQWMPFDPPREVPVTDVIGNVTREKVPGQAIFQRGGRTFALQPTQETPDGPLFFVFADATSDQETDPAARFLYADRPRGSKVVLDFNRAYNPPCAFTPYATCPLPTRENRLALAVTAGEKKYRGEPE